MINIWLDVVLFPGLSSKTSGLILKFDERNSRAGSRRCTTLIPLLHCCFIHCYKTFQKINIMDNLFYGDCATFILMFSLESPSACLA